METGESFDDHPIGFITLLCGIFGDDLVLTFSRYVYAPRARVDVRETFRVAATQVSPSWLRFQLLSLQPSQELALHSRVTIGRTVRHIPMLDFRGMTKGQLTAIMDVFPESFSHGLHVYFSGRSYHAYFPQLLTQSKWIKFMGSALLCSSPNDSSVIDQRWVGHRLIGGYASLRWSCNTSHYKSYPRLIETSELDKAFIEKQKKASSIRATAGYYEDLVEIAIRNIGVIYHKGPLGRTIDPDTRPIHYVDFLVDLPGLGRVGIEVVYCQDRLLSKRQVVRILKQALAVKAGYNAPRLLVITNAKLADSDKRLLLTSNPNIDLIEEAVSPDELLTQLRGSLSGFRSRVGRNEADHQEVIHGNFSSTIRKN